MVRFNEIPNIYFLGIGGIGMSALARYANAVGKNVAGYDLTETALTRQLVSEGIAVHYQEEINQFSSIFLKENTLVVRTPAVPDTNQELQYVVRNGYHMVKRSELLGFLTNGKVCVAVAGTHGKTSVSTMISHLLHESGADTGAFLGGISRNFNSNLVLPHSADSLIVTEADEFDRSFLHLSPSIAVVTSTDADHLDIYGSHEYVKDAFSQFVGKVKAGGKVLLKKGLDLHLNVAANTKIYTYSIDEDADFSIANLRINNGIYEFDVRTPNATYAGVKMSYPGRVNVENMLAAVAASLLAGISFDRIEPAIFSYKGVVRRFDVRFKNAKVIYIDDYAHHPRELEYTIRSVKELYGSKKVLGIFQPHLFSRTKDFADGFAASLDLLDEAILLPIYPARELPIPGVTSELILDKITIGKKSILKLSDVVNALNDKEFDVLLTMGAGNIDQLVDPITSMLNHQFELK